MTCIAAEAAGKPTANIAFNPLLRIRDWLRRLRKTPSRLDLDAVPDRVKRDLGFLDGREPYYEDDGRRR
jgi:hypothetical protein